ncbi:MAG: lipoyl(octanoyl) transferase LipB, partial [Granulosicoccaceae bacterium]
MIDPHSYVLRQLGRLDYTTVFDAQRAFTDARDELSPDEFWLVEHPPVFTQGQAGKPEHLLDAGGIPVVQSDRGGQITYHGPGQVVLYMLVDLRRRGLGVRAAVTALEAAVIALLAARGVAA